MTIDNAAASRYLTSIISSELGWLSSEHDREQIRELAATCLAHLAGRSAAPAIDRVFEVNSNLHITLHEPSLTGDNLGLKTWTSSLLLAKRLAVSERPSRAKRPQVLELGAGTGLVGIAVAWLWQTDVTLTDLADIVPNLRRNVESNAQMVAEAGGTMKTATLNWSDQVMIPDPGARFDIVVAADPIYSPEHPVILVSTISKWLKSDSEARFILELPLREHYRDERLRLEELLAGIGLEKRDEGIETGFDDWRGQDGQFLEVRCWWSIWKPAFEAK